MLVMLGDAGRPRDALLPALVCWDIEPIRLLLPAAAC